MEWISAKDDGTVICPSNQDGKLVFGGTQIFVMMWISVKDRVPEKGGRYLVYRMRESHSHMMVARAWSYPCCEPNIAYYRPLGLWIWNDSEEKECLPTHWMPLPEPPKDIL